MQKLHSTNSTILLWWEFAAEESRQESSGFFMRGILLYWKGELMEKTKKDTPVWKKKAPKTTKKTKLTEAQIAEAKARAAKAGRQYPNLVDNMAVACKAKKAKGET